MGKPTKYKPEFCERLITHMSQGLSFESFAGSLSVCKQTVYNWRKLQKDFGIAFGIGIEKSRLFWERKGLEALHDKSINPAIWIFTMKCRFRDEWGEKLPEKSDESVSLNDLKILIEHAGLLKAEK
jgi:hypothetical protein